MNFAIKENELAKAYLEKKKSYASDTSLCQVIDLSYKLSSPSLFVLVICRNVDIHYTAVFLRSMGHGCITTNARVYKLHREGEEGIVGAQGLCEQGIFI